MLYINGNKLVEWQKKKKKEFPCFQKSMFEEGKQVETQDTISVGVGRKETEGF